MSAAAATRDVRTRAAAVEVVAGMVAVGVCATAAKTVGAAGASDASVMVAMMMGAVGRRVAAAKPVAAVAGE